jgi:ABC-2 type transport system ATP-binding protein
MIEANGLTKHFGSRIAVDHLTFSIAVGETVGFLGPNGAGKSTTMRLLTGFLGPTAGTARVGGFDVAENPLEARKRMGYLPESNPLYREMRVSEFLHYRAKIKGLARYQERVKAVNSAMDRCRISDVSGRIIGQLSKGYRQRVGLADCILGSPPLLILDEPTVGLDPNQVLETRSLIQELGTERTVFLSTHILHEVERLCKRVIIINHGRIAADGAPEELRKKYAEERKWDLYIASAENKSAPVLESVRERLLKVEGVNDALALPPSISSSFAEEKETLAVQVVTDARIDARRSIAETVLAGGYLVLEMREEPVQLEDIFAKITLNQ